MSIAGKFASSSSLIAVLFLGLSACNKAQNATIAQNAPPSQDQPQSGDPANGNLAPAGQAPAATSQASYSQPVPSQPAPPPPATETYVSQNAQSGTDQDVGYYDTASNEPPVYAPQPPPELPTYSQPECPGENYFWTPGYWNYAGAGYYWVPGAWVLAPYVGALWTPPYWGYQGNRYILHIGYWGPHIGFYGGINYGFGYTGRGYYGAYWNRGAVYYNRNVTNINVSVIHNVYNYSAPVVTNVRVSYNGGQGGLNVRPIPAEQAALRDRRIAPVPAQFEHAREAANNREQFASVNRGQPQTLVSARPLATSYRAPAPQPPVESRPAQRMPVPENRAQFQPAPRPQEAHPQENRSAADTLRRQETQAPMARPAPPEARAPQQFSRPENRPAPQQAQPMPAARPAPEARAPQQFSRPEHRPAPQQAPQPMPAARQNVPENRPAPQARPAPQQMPRQPENRPAPAARPNVPENRPAPAARPAPQQMQRPPENRPAPPAQRAEPPHPGPAPEHHPDEHKGK